MYKYALIVLVTMLAIKAVLPDTIPRDTVENVGDNLTKFTDTRNGIACYYVSGFPEGLTCVKL